MHVKSIATYILQYFRPSLSNPLSSRPFLSIFEEPLKTGLTVFRYWCQRSKNKPCEHKIMFCVFIEAVILSTTYILVLWNYSLVHHLVIMFGQLLDEPADMSHCRAMGAEASLHAYIVMCEVYTTWCTKLNFYFVMLFTRNLD